MSRQADTVIGRAVVDSLEFARDGGVLVGSVPIAGLERLADVIADSNGVLVCELRGVRDGEGKSFLDLLVAGEVNLRCQRCLSLLPFSLEIDSHLLLVPLGDPWPDEDLVEDGVDAIEASRELRVSQLIEDEVLLALPIAPRHEDCRPPVGAAEHRPSPFAALARLKDH
jgi:uncharacterized protein